jgi:hypothetical protein
MEEELRTSEEADRRKKEEERLRALALTTPAQPALAQPAGSEPASQAAEVNPGALNEVMAAENSDGRGRMPVKLEAPIDETQPRIMPPSTGEQVAASHPNSLTALAQAAKESGSPADSDPSNEPAAVPAPMEQPASEPEQAAHHG